MVLVTFLKISWWNDHDLGDVVYQSGFRNVIYLDIEVDEPAYQTTIESDLNGDNVEVTKFRKWVKMYHFKTWMTEDLVDAFSFMQIHDNVEVTLQTGQLIEAAKHSLRAEVKWETIGCLAEVNVTFNEDYVVAGNCDENKSAECLCTESAGDINVVDEYPGTTAGDGQIGLLWTVEDVAGKKYTGHLYEFTNDGYQWLLLADPPQNTCYLNKDTNPDTTFIFDGQYWILYPGFILTIAQPAPAVNDIVVTGEVIPGAFCSVYVLLGIGWTNMGDFTAAEIAAGVTINVPEDGSKDFKLKVWNHSCDYGFTEIETFVIA